MADRGSSNDPHRYCGPVFPSDASLAGRVNVEYVRHTDGLRIEEEVSDYRAGQGQAAVDDYAAALRTCTHYTTGSGATSLTIEMAPTSWAKQRGNASTSGTVTFSNNQVTLYSRLVIFRTVNRVVVASISSTDQATLKQVAAGLAEQAWTTATSASPTAPQSR